MYRRYEKDLCKRDLKKNCAKETLKRPVQKRPYIKNQRPVNIKRDMKVEILPVFEPTKETCIKRDIHTLTETKKKSCRRAASGVVACQKNLYKRDSYI